MKKIRVICIILIILNMFTFSGCSAVDASMVKLGFWNNDFEYFKTNTVDKIIIQNVRDAGFRFVVTDTSAINEIYDILHKASIKENKTSLDPDYYFEIYIGEKVKKYTYVVGVNEKGVGSFYNDEKVYDVSGNLDETILNNLSFIRKPKDFEKVYYESILKILEMKKDDLSNDNKVGIDISGDVNCLKYMFSTQLEDFKDQLDKCVSGTTFVNNNSDDFDTVISVNNRGYNTRTFKTTIIYNNKKDKVYQTYYVTGNYEYKSWNITVSEPDEKPDNW